MRQRIEIIAQPGAAPDAVLANNEHVARRLMGDRGRFDARLTIHWGVPVVCTREFAAVWLPRPDRPAGFFLEALGT